MPTAAMRATLEQATAAGQDLLSHKADYQQYWQDVALDATTDLNFLSQVVLKNNAPSPVLSVPPNSPLYNADHWKEKQQAYKAMLAPKGTAQMIPGWLLLLLQAAEPAIAEWIKKLLGQ